MWGVFKVDGGVHLRRVGRATRNHPRRQRGIPHRVIDVVAGIEPNRRDVRRELPVRSIDRPDALARHVDEQCFIEHAGVAKRPTGHANLPRAIGGARGHERGSRAAGIGCRFETIANEHVQSAPERGGRERFAPGTASVAELSNETVWRRARVNLGEVGTIGRGDGNRISEGADGGIIERADRRPPALVESEAVGHAEQRLVAGLARNVGENSRLIGCSFRLNVGSARCGPAHAGCLVKGAVWGRNARWPQ